MNITCIGTGYVGLVTGTCFAERGNDVTCVDIDTAKIARLVAGDVPIYEPALSDLVVSNFASGRLHFTTDLSDAVTDADIVFLALPTPPAGDGSADLSYVLGVCKQLEQIVTKNIIIATKSTVPVGSGDTIEAILTANGKNNFAVVSNPEFLREGSAVQDFMHPDRVVIGGTADWAILKMQELYAPFLDIEKIIIMDRHSAELSKYAANAFLAMKVTFINEIANLSQRVAGDVQAIAHAIGLDERIGGKYLQAGIGFGGSCFPKDVRALVSTASSNGYDFEIMKAVISVNKKQRLHLIDRLIAHFDGEIAGKQIALWGLAFKPETDDIRESPALTIIEELTDAGAIVVAYDPKASQQVAEHLATIDTFRVAPNMYQAVEDADALVIATDWQEFKTADLGRVMHEMTSPFIFDGRNIYDPAKLKSLGFTYLSIGR